MRGQAKNLVSDLQCRVMKPSTCVDGVLAISQTRRSWIAKHTKEHETHERLSWLSRSFAIFVVQTFPACGHSTGSYALTIPKMRLP